MTHLFSHTRFRAPKTRSFTYVALVVFLSSCAQKPSLSQGNAPTSLPATIAVSAEVAGRTPERIGYVLGENRPGSNVSSWLRYDEINAARFWWPTTLWPALPAPWTEQNTLAKFESERARLRRNPDAEVDWTQFRAAVSQSYGGTPQGTLGDSFLLSELHRIGAAPLVVLAHSRTAYPFDAADGTPDWHGRWAFWRGVYTDTFYLARTYGVERFQLFNEPDHKISIDLTQDDYLRRLQLGSDAIQAAINDVNRLDKKALRAQISAPVSAGLAVFGPRPGRSDTRDAVRGWGELTVAAQNADFAGKSADNRGLFGTYAFQNYTRTPATISDRLPAMVQSIAAANGGAAIPFIASEMNVSTAADFAKTDATLDSPGYYAAFGAIAAAYSNAGLSEGYVFRHTQTNNLDGGQIKKNGTHFLDNADPLKNILGSTKGAEVARLWIRGFKGGKTRFAVPVLPANLYYLAARDETNGAYSVLISNLGEARQVSLDLGAWHLPAGTLAKVEEVSETHHGDVKAVSGVPANGQFSLPMSANSVDLLTFRPGLSAAPRVLPAIQSQGVWRVATPFENGFNSTGGQYLLVLQGQSTQNAQRVRIYSGEGDVSQAQLLGQVTLGAKRSEVLIDVTRYAREANRQMLFRTVPDDARSGSKSFSIVTAQLQVFSALNSAAPAKISAADLRGFNAPNGVAPSQISPEMKTNADGAPLEVPAGPQPTRTLVYKSTTDAAGAKVELQMHVFEPANHKASDKTPAIVLFFGGGWNDGNASIFFPHCAYLASRGMVAIAPDYRVKTRQKTSPFECVADGKSALRFVRQNARAWGIDPNRIAAGGSSAGGHVAACTALLPGLDEKSEDAAISSVPNALVLFNPVIDTSPAGYGNERLGARWEEISPRQHVRPGLPPTLVFHGTADKTVPYANAADFQKAMQAAGNRCELETLRGVGHGFAYRIQKKSANFALRQSDVFLASLGYLRGEPTLPAPTQP